MVTYAEYHNDFVAFAKKHRSGEGWKVTESESANDVYMKAYTFADGAQWFEVCRPVFESAEVVIKGVKTEVKAKLFCLEYWNTETPSKFYYEKY